MNKISIWGRILSSTITIGLGFLLHYTVWDGLNVWSWSIGCVGWQILDGIIAYFRFRKPKSEREHDKFMKQYNKGLTPNSSVKSNSGPKDPILG